jgi:hypothetical protein
MRILFKMLPLSELLELGFVKDGICESIVSTYNPERKPHASPIGISTNDMHLLILRIYQNSQTYKNLIKWKSGVANITSDPTLFHITTFKDSFSNSQIPEEMFEHEDAVDAPRLRNVDGCIALKLIKKEDNVNPATIVCRVEKILIKGNPRLKVYNRGSHAVIESLIHATRIKLYLQNGDKEKVKELIRLVDNYHRIVKKVAPNSELMEIMDDITCRINGWKKV